jgi:hypothetical protein
MALAAPLATEVYCVAGVLVSTHSPVVAARVTDKAVEDAPVRIQEVAPRKSSPAVSF